LVDVEKVSDSLQSISMENADLDLHKQSLQRDEGLHQVHIIHEYLDIFHSGIFEEEV
jgi:hypothetical protein